MQRLLTRAVQHSEGRRLTTVAFAILATIILLSSAIGAYAAYNPDTNNIITGSLPTPDQHKEYLRKTEQGNESMSLSARLREDGGLINRNISWTVSKRDVLSAKLGTQVYSGKTPLAEMKLEPGHYHITVRYGYAELDRNVKILPGTNLSVVFVLNVGGIRTLSQVTGLAAADYALARHSIIALFDNKPEKLIASSIQQGEIVRLPAGNYRIESRFPHGNTVATAHVTIKPGILTSLNIDHQAAFAKLLLRKNGETPVKWKISSLQTNWTTSGNIAQPKMILSPGRYVFSAKIDGQKFSRTVQLVPGKATVIILGPDS